MARTFPISDPGKFFEEFVLRAYNEHLAMPLDPYCAKMAALNADIMAERVWDTFKDRDPAKIANAKNAAEYRRYLVANECEDFQLVWDVNDNHKHAHLDRRPRKISSAAQAGVRSRGGAIGSVAIGEAPLGGSIEEFVVVLDDGSERLLSQVLSNVIQMWERILPRLRN